MYSQIKYINDNGGTTTEVCDGSLLHVGWVIKSQGYSSYFAAEPLLSEK